MNCPYCQFNDSKVIDSRDSQDGSIIRRRRGCLKCEQRFTTYERIEEPYPAVIKKDGRREDFDANKILEGVRKSCEKRPIPRTTIEALVDRICRAVQELGENEISAQWIGEKVMAELHGLDEIAYVRFAAVYRSFRDINELMGELKAVLDKQG